jgi:hypothetical protein
MAKLRRALVGGRRASFWFYADDCLVLRHPGGRTETSIPVAHLIRDDMMDEHVLRLGDKDWVPRGAISELLEIAAGASR